MKQTLNLRGTNRRPCRRNLIRRPPSQLETIRLARHREGAQFEPRKSTRFVGLRGRFYSSGNLNLMPENYRFFEAGPDPFGRTWHVEFRWLQTAISIRHADTVDVKFIVWARDEPKQEKVIALPHSLLLELSEEAKHELTDAWCLKLAGSHVRYM